LAKFGQQMVSFILISMMEIIMLGLNFNL
jgi:hypothetical protein